eukprot:614890_1
MEVLESILTDLKVLQSVGLDTFGMLLTRVFSSSIGEPQDDKVVKNSELSPIQEKCLIASLLSLLLELCKQDHSLAEIRTLLEDHRFSSEQSGKFVELYKSHKTRIRSRLGGIGFDFDKVVGIDWRLDHSFQSSDDGKLGAPIFLVTLKMLTPSGKPSNTSFCCSLEQMTDLLAKVKQATRQVDQLVK